MKEALTKRAILFIKLKGIIMLNANNKYMIPLHMLGMSFLRHQALPVHLMKDRDIVLEIEFSKQILRGLIYAFAESGFECNGGLWSARFPSGLLG